MSSPIEIPAGPGTPIPVAGTPVSGADVLVERDALAQYYDRLWQVYDHLGAAVLRGDGLRQIAETPDRFAGHRIAGVEHALHSARTSMHGAEGQHQTLCALHRIITNHLQAVYDTYASYLSTDATQSSDLGTTPDVLTPPPLG